VVIPAYNEEKRLPVYLSEILSYLEKTGTAYEIIVVDDGSTDDTTGVVTGFSRGNDRVKLLSLPRNRGKGYAVRTGMMAARGGLLLFTDADGATPIRELERLQAALERGADLAIASRALHDDCCAVQAHLHRKIIGDVFNLLVTVLAVSGIRDTQCGFKLFRADTARTVFPLQRIEDFGFDVELLYLCRKNGYRITEVPVNWSDVQGSKVGVLRDSVRMLGDLFKIRINDLRGAYTP
jgi:dolichyl-phosphate beta-glucosyltransferase